MNLWKGIRKIEWLHLIDYGRLLLRRPLLVYPIYRATQYTLAVSKRLYGMDHFKSGPANAFRHAFWNVCLCNIIYRRVKDTTIAMAYCEDIVNYYEKATKNLPLDRCMDYHNNQIGRMVFLQNLNENEQKLIEILQNMTENAKKVINFDDLSNYQNSLVYIEEDSSGGILLKTKTL